MNSVSKISLSSSITLRVVGGTEKGGGDKKLRKKKEEETAKSPGEVLRGSKAPAQPQAGPLSEADF